MRSGSVSPLDKALGKMLDAGVEQSKYDKNRNKEVVKQTLQQAAHVENRWAWLDALDKQDSQGAQNSSGSEGKGDSQDKGLRLNLPSKQPTMTKYENILRKAAATPPTRVSSPNTQKKAKVIGVIKKKDKIIPPTRPMATVISIKNQGGRKNRRRTRRLTRRKRKKTRRKHRKTRRRKRKTRCKK